MPANEMLKVIREKSELLEIDRKFYPFLNEGFSGGEKNVMRFSPNGNAGAKISDSDETDWT
jgi:Fe-S cluster assembly ATP-binding protein